MKNNDRRTPAPRKDGQNCGQNADQNSNGNNNSGKNCK